MIVGKILKFATKPEQPGLSGSIRLEVVQEQNWLVKLDHKSQRILAHRQK